MKNISFIFFVISFFSTAQAEVSNSLVERAQKFDQRYQLKSEFEKLVDNRGEGYENLYGVRNFRQVLKGILYRGGANNLYNKYGQRENQNPLPTLGLKNLCSEGFGVSVYLYEKNFSSAPKAVNCTTVESTQNSLKYMQLTAANTENTEVYLDLIYQAVKGRGASPIYMHCWNGWHASGLVSALALKQFCGFSGEQALNYWTKNTDGNSSGYESIKKRIVDFKPLSKYKISVEEQNQICL